MGEDRVRTERDVSRDRPGDQMVRVTVAEAARRLDISEAGVRKRVQRSQIPYERDNDGRLFVWISPGETRHAEFRDESEESRNEAALVEEVRDRLRFVEHQLEAERQAHGETRRLLLSALERIPPAIEAPPGERESPITFRTGPERVEPRESPESTADEQQGSGPIPDARGAQQATERPWWRRMFGG